MMRKHSPIGGWWQTDKLSSKTIVKFGLKQFSEIYIYCLLMLIMFMQGSRKVGVMQSSLNHPSTQRQYVTPLSSFTFSALGVELNRTLLPKDPLGVTREQAATPSPQHSFPTLVFARLYLLLLARLNLSFCTRARVDFFARRPGLIAQAIYQNLLVSLSSCLPF